MGRKKKSKALVENSGEPFHRVHIESFRPPVGGFRNYQEAYLFAKNNLKISAGADKEEAIRKAIDTYQPTRKSRNQDVYP